MAGELDIANLVLAVDSTGVVKANTALDELAVKGDLVGKTWESGAQRTRAASRQMAQDVSQAQTDIQRAINRTVSGGSENLLARSLKLDSLEKDRIVSTYRTLFNQISQMEAKSIADARAAQQARYDALVASGAVGGVPSFTPRARPQSVEQDVGMAAQDAAATRDAIAMAEERQARSASKAAAAETDLQDAMFLANASTIRRAKSLDELYQSESALERLYRDGKISMSAYATGLNAISTREEKLALDAERLGQGFKLNAMQARELGSDIRAVAVGDFTRLESSLIATANRFNLFQSLLSGTGLLYVGLGASIIGLAALVLKGQEAENEYNASLALTDHYAGLSLGSIHALSNEMRGAGITVGNAVSIFTKLAESGKYTSDQIELIGKTALIVAQRTGQSADSIVKEFDRIEQEPAKAVLEYDKMYHFLTAATLQRINELEREGKTQEAAYVAQQALSDTMVSRLKNEQENVGYLTQAWRGLKDMISEAATAVESWGQKQEHIDKANDARATASTMLDVYQQRRSSTGLAHVWAEGKFGQFTDEQLLAQINHFNDIAVAEEKLAHDQDDQNRKQAQADANHTEALANANAYAQQGLTLQQALNAEKIKYQNTLSNLRPEEKTPDYLAELQKGEDRTLLSIRRSYDRKDRVPSDHGLGRAQDRANASELNPELAKDYATYTDAIKQNENALKDYKETADQFYTNQDSIIATWATSSVAAIIKQEDAIRSNMGTGKKYYQSEAELNALETKRIDILGKAASAFDEASAKKAEAMRREEQEIARYAASVGKEILALKQEAIAQEQSAGMGDRQGQRYNDDMQIVLKEAQDEQRIRLKYANDPTVMNKEIQISKKGANEELAIVADKYRKMAAADESYANGFNRFIQNTIVEYRDVATQTQQLLTSSLQTFNQDFIQQIETGKADWKSLVLDVVNGFAEMELKAEEAKLLQKFFGDKSQESGGGADMVSAVAGLTAAAAEWQVIVTEIGVVATDLEAAAAMAMASGGSGSGGGGYTGGDSGGSYGEYASLISGVISAFAANGAVFGGGGLMPMRRGGYMVTSPTLRAMASGGTAMIGEAGPEGVFPLRKDSAGRLGVMASGGVGSSGDVHVSIKDYSGGQKPEVHESKDANGNKLIEIILGKAEDRISQSVANGKVGKAIQGRFGVSKQGQRF